MLYRFKVLVVEPWSTFSGSSRQDCDERDERTKMKPKACDAGNVGERFVRRIDVMIRLLLVGLPHIVGLG